MWIPTTSWDHWTVPISSTFLRIEGTEQSYPIGITDINGIFDPQVDHLYVNALHFQILIKPNIEQIYGVDVITCNFDECFFKDMNCADAMQKYKKNVVL